MCKPQEDVNAEIIRRGVRVDRGLYCKHVSMGFHNKFTSTECDLPRVALSTDVLNRCSPSNDGAHCVGAWSAVRVRSPSGRHPADPCVALSGILLARCPSTPEHATAELTQGPSTRDACRGTRCSGGRGWKPLGAQSTRSSSRHLSSPLRRPCQR